MRQRLLKIIGGSLLCLAAACAHAPDDSTPASQSGAVAGGYSTTDKNTDQVKAAAAFATQQLNKGTLVRVADAQSQVVAGINYRLKLEIAHPDGSHHYYTVVVFVPLPNTGDPMQLTSSQYLGMVKN